MTVLWYILIVVAAVVVFALGGARRTSAAETPEKSTEPPAVTASSVKRLNRAELARKLAAITWPDVARNMMLGAMCYVPAPKADLETPYAIYVCPVCGSKSLYLPSRQGFDMVFHNELRVCRQIVKELSEQFDGIELDESLFCRECYPSNNCHYLALRIVYDDGTTSKSSRIDTDDLRLLKDTIDGKIATYSFQLRTAGDEDVGKMLWQREVDHLRDALDLPATSTLSTNAVSRTGGQ